MTDQTPPAHGCTIDGQPAIPILIADYNQLIVRAEEAEALAEQHARNTKTVARERESYRRAWKEEQTRRAHAEAEVRRWAESDSADAAAGSYAGRAETAETKLTAVGVLRDDLHRITGARWIAAALDHILGEQTAAHVYLSTGCLHGDHDYCKSMTGLNGTKRPTSCKGCGAKCICGCHAAEEAVVPAVGPDRVALVDNPAPAASEPAARIRQLQDLLAEILDETFAPMRYDGVGPIEYYQAPRILPMVYERWTAERDGKVR